MNARHLMHVTLRLFAIFLIADVIYLIASGAAFYLESLNQKTTSGIEASTLTTFYLYLFAILFLYVSFYFGRAYFFWVCAPKIASYIIPRGKDMREGTDREIKAIDLQTAAFIIMGLFILSNVIYKMVDWPCSIVLIKKLKNISAFDISTIQGVDNTSFAYILEILPNLIVGIFLIVWGKRLSTFLSKRNRQA